MTARIMNGTSVANALLDDTRQRAAVVEKAIGRRPCLTTVLVGDDPASATYVRMKRARSGRNGIDSRSVEMPAATTTNELVVRIADLSRDPAIDGILLQHPVPPDIDERAAFEAIAPHKDVDGVTMASFAAMAKPVPTPSEPSAPGSIQLPGPRGRTACAEIVTTSPPSPI